MNTFVIFCQKIRCVTYCKFQLLALQEMSWFSSVFRKENPQPTQTKYLVTFNTEIKVWEIPRTEDGWAIQSLQATKLASAWKKQALQAWEKKPEGLINSLNQIDPSAQYMIATAQDMKKVIDIAINKQIEKCKAGIYEGAGSSNQRFKFIPANEGKYKIQCMYGGMLQVPNGSRDNNVQIALANVSDSAHQQWSIEPVEGVVCGFMIRTFCGKCLYLNKEKNFDVVQWTVNKNVSRGQVWYLRKI